MEEHLFNGLPENVELKIIQDLKINHDFYIKKKKLYTGMMLISEWHNLVRSHSPFPVNHHSTDNKNKYVNNFPQNMLIKTSRKNEMKADINARLGYSPLSINTPFQQEIIIIPDMKIAPYPTHSNNPNSSITSQNNDNNNNNKK